MADQEKINQKIREVLDLCGKEKYIFRGENKIHPKVSSNLYRRYYELIKSAHSTLKCNTLVKDLVWGIL